MNSKVTHAVIVTGFVFGLFEFNLLALGYLNDQGRFPLPAPNNPSKDNDSTKNHGWVLPRIDPNRQSRGIPEIKCLATNATQVIGVTDPE